MTRERRPTEKDERLVGLSFIEVLFAIVVARALDPLADFPKLPGVGLSHLAVAGVLTIASWIGYHNSWNRPRYFIRFPNLPLGQFLVDAALVVTYWLTAVWAEGSGSELGKVRLGPARSGARRRQLRAVRHLGRPRHPQL